MCLQPVDVLASWVGPSRLKGMGGWELGWRPTRKAHCGKGIYCRLVRTTIYLGIFYQGAQRIVLDQLGRVGMPSTGGYRRYPGSHV